MDLAAIIEKAINESMHGAVSRVVSKRMHSPDLQKVLDDRVKVLMLEILAEPEFKDEVRKLLLKALQAEPKQAEPALITVYTPQPSPISIATGTTCRFCFRAIDPGQVDCGICTAVVG